MDKIIIKEDVIPEIDQLMDLYNDVKWSDYTDDKIKLKNVINNSLKVLTAWDDAKTINFYQKNGMIKASDYNCVTFVDLCETNINTN